MMVKEIIQKLEQKKIVDLNNFEYIRLGKLKTMIFAEFNIEVSISELKEYMECNEEFVEISKNFFVMKTKLKELLKGISKDRYKSYLEDKYIVQIEEETILSLLGERKRKYEDLLRFGLDNSYIDSRWLSELDIENSNFTDIYEVMEEFESKGIIIK